jgi:hypothetical protein
MRCQVCFASTAPLGDTCCGSEGHASLCLRGLTKAPGGSGVFRACYTEGATRYTMGGSVTVYKLRAKAHH